MFASGKFAEFVHLLRARVALMAGRREIARAALKKALRRNPGSFTARFLLGRLYLKEGAIFKMKREFDLAWQIDPERFERFYSRLKTQGETAPDVFSFEPEQDQGVRVELGPKVETHHRGESESRRLGALPPISREEIRRIDWDQFEAEIYPDD